MQFTLGQFEQGRTTILPVFVGQSLDAFGLKSKDYYGKKKDHPVFADHAGTRFILVGLGEPSKFKVNKLREALALGARAAVKEGETAVTVVLPLAADVQLSVADVVFVGVESYLMGEYRYDRYKSNKEELTVKSVVLASFGDDLTDQADAVKKGEAYAQGNIIARDLMNAPSNKLKPFGLADFVTQQFAGTKAQVEVLKGDDLEAHRFVGLQAVGKGSVHPPAMIKVTYQGDASKQHVALVGKGMTFDTGGISLKIARDISDMRMDMGGAAAVIGALHILVALDAPVNVTMLVPTAESMPDGNAFLPGDVLEYPNGKTVHVGNTDAEGRLILADALLWSKELGAETVVDIATLTGACMMALGKKIAGLWGDDAAVSGLVESSKLIGEYVWPMPELEEYQDLFYSPFADLRNITETPGAITAAMFLRHFVAETQNWAHLDIAGTMMYNKVSAYGNEGGTGFGARLLADWVIGQ